MRERRPGRYRGRILLLAIMVGGALLAQSLLSRPSASTSEADVGSIDFGEARKRLLALDK